MCVCVCVHACACVGACVCMCVCLSVCVSMYIRTHVCVYIEIHIVCTGCKWHKLYYNKINIHIIITVTQQALPYAWYIWRTLSLAIWEQTQVG